MWVRKYKGTSFVLGRTDHPVFYSFDSVVADFAFLLAGVVEEDYPWSDSSLDDLVRNIPGVPAGEEDCVVVG